jgi:Secretion system C-terminal sorting domain
MSRIYLIYCLFALIVASSSLAHAQNMVPNGDIELNCGANTGGCPTFTATCIPGWSRSHGTPQLNITSGNVGPSELAMWNAASGTSTTGEGVFATLTSPTPVRGKYELCFFYRVVAGSTGTGSLVARFTTGLVAATGTTCGDPIPSPTTELVVHNSPVIAGGWQRVAVTTSSLSAFTQLNVYPVANSTNVLWVEVDGFELNYCGTNLLATPSTIPMPSGLYARSGSITASSLSGTGLVSADPSVSTTFRAGQYVLLEPNFVSTPNSGKYFLAEIGTCGCVAASARSIQTETPELTSKDIDPAEYLMEEFEAFNVALHPNPVRELVTLNANASLRQVRVMDLSGKVLLDRFVLDDLQVMTVDMSGLSSGVYLIEAQAKTGGRVVTKLVKD